MQQEDGTHIFRLYPTLLSFQCSFDRLDPAQAIHPGKQRQLSSSWRQIVVVDLLTYTANCRKDGANSSQIVLIVLQRYGRPMIIFNLDGPTSVHTDGNKGYESVTKTSQLLTYSKLFVLCLVYMYFRCNCELCMGTVYI